MEFPKWLVPFRDNPEWRKSFEDWVDTAISVYEHRALHAVDNFEQLQGLRYAAGELLALKAFLYDYDAEITREQERVDNEID